MKRGTEAWRRVLDTETRAPEKPPDDEAVRAACLTVLHHPDIAQVGRRATLPFPHLDQGPVSAGHESAALSRLEPIFGGSGGAGPLADPFISRRPLLFHAEGHDLLLDAEGTSTRLEVNGSETRSARFHPDEIEDGAILCLGERVVLVLHWASPVPPEHGDSLGMVGGSDAMARLRRDIRRLATLPAPVLIRGESGTGKELVARALHDAGTRRPGPFVAVNMAAIPPSLAAAELFGNTKGAFTGADRTRKGHFARADGGTLFLDEIGDTPTEIQPLLLRALETGEIQPVGGEHVMRPDVRVVAATDLDLEAAIADGRFRSPLLHRLQALSLRLPPLRERRSDFGRLLVHFLRAELREAGHPELLELARPDAAPWLPASLVVRMALARWPGNIRELRNIARRLVASARDQPRIDQEIEREVIAELVEAEPTSSAALDLSKASKSDVHSPGAANAKSRKPSEISDQELFETLRRHRFKVKPAAEELKISRPSLYERMVTHPDLRRAGDLSPQELRDAHRDLGGDIEELVDFFAVSADALRRRLRELRLEI